MWQYLDGFFRREVDEQRAQELPTRLTSGMGPHVLGLLTAGEFGTRQAFQAPVLSIGTSIPYPKQTLWLRLDLPNLRETRPEAVADTTWVVRKRYGEPAILLAPHERYMERIDPERRRCTQENLAWLEAHPHVLDRIVLHHRHYRYPFIPDLDADAGLYQNGFFTRTDEALCRDFHAVELARFDAAAWRGCVDIVVAGFPCQPFSTASRGRPVEPDLWPEVLRVVRELRPWRVFLENVQRVPIEAASGDLEKLGYRGVAAPLDSTRLGTPHKRVRWWLLADLDGDFQPTITGHDEVARVSQAGFAGWWQEAPGDLLGVDDGIQARMDRLRWLGHGVVPQQAALAYPILSERLYQ